MRLPQIWIDYLSELPETGMGYQRVNLSFRDGSMITVVVYNSEEFESPDGIPYINVGDIIGVSVLPNKTRG